MFLPFVVLNFLFEQGGHDGGTHAGRLELLQGLGFAGQRSGGGHDRVGQRQPQIRRRQIDTHGDCSCGQRLS